MRYQRSHKTLVPSNLQVHQGMITIVGSLVVLSVFMLVLGVTSTTAQTGQDARCSEFTGQAKGLCTAAVSEGCFDGVESQECEDLTTNWNERCRRCEGEAPWEEVTCPCAGMSAVELNEIFEAQQFDTFPITRSCRDGTVTTVFRETFDDPDAANVFVTTGDDLRRGRHCSYFLTDDAGSVPIFQAFFRGLTIEEVEACREDIRLLMAQLTDCPTP